MPPAYPLAPVRTEALLRIQAAALQAHPKFDQALHLYTRGVSDYREANHGIGKLTANEDRYRALNFFFYLWAESVAKGEGGAVTYSALFEVCRRGEVTTRTLKTMLALAIFTGFAERRPHPTDRRSKLYIPTARMIAFPDYWITPAAAANDLLLPGADRVRRLRDDPDLLVHFFRSSGREFGAGVQPMTIQPEFMAFYGNKEGGSAMVMALLLADMENLPPPNRAEISRRFGLSKSQVTQLIAQGQAAGMLQISDGVVRATQTLHDDHAEWTALCLAFLDPHMCPPDHVA
ncbi:hypothetical protein [Devosia sp. 2618]|uniref:hypothetical protein n=1 Tax=Devosia sp. 2618 TaxID=3156454 RepID=UPI003391DA16